ncbi:hypothetical protein [Natronobacterium gregoryi]|uniref:Uncharacterized protein n=2 Tax=Natronobacterium gregoryi TaxID=44930 RepID=L0AK97_NATGS|nr:hypothetical protein [Natronobacterium gregoryi]AFZ74318.1 hypothetical protein Natgr_3188 [Natronobacterium gregoryi SP2]ELY63550.1 hypothetical protein C490_16069 [Natronobacterium gregoryi SP2]PLK22172.1 hypothetical protein CYV19_00405 [Natronobacterium gregoryi SP2]SFI53617.1 hypothetical protein SAMN05443661_101207 [Natronobacterium gregoryi]
MLQESGLPLMTPPGWVALALLGVWVLVMFAVPCVAAYHQWRWTNGLTDGDCPFPDEATVPSEESVDD